MSNARGETDRIRCDVSHCRVSISFGGWGYGLSNRDAREAAATRHSWVIVGHGPSNRDLCPDHAYLAARDQRRAADVENENIN